MRTRTKILLAVVAVIGVTATVQVIKRPRRLSVARVVVVLAAARALTWFGFSTWWGVLGGAASSAVAATEAFVGRAVSLALTFYNAAMNLVLNVIRDGVSYAADAISVLSSWAGSLFNDVDYIVHTFVPIAIQYAETFLGEALNAITAAIRYVVAETASVLQIGIAEVTSAWHTVYQDVVFPVVQFVTKAGTWFIKEVTSWWTYIWRNGIIPWLNQIVWLITHVPQWLDYLATKVVTVVTLVEGAETWLVWLAEHSLEDLYKLATTIENGTSKSAILTLSKGTPALFTTIEDQFVALMGHI